MLTLVGDLLADGKVDSVARARSLLNCLSCAESHDAQRCDDCSRGKIGRASIDPDSHACRTIVESAPDLRDAILQFGTDEIIALLSIARRERPDLYTHSLTVSRIARALTGRVSSAPSLCIAVTAAALFHDLGKLLRPALGSREHGSRGDDDHGELTQALLVACGIANPLARAAAQHHEHLDGSGGPHGLSHDQIGIGGRILAVSEIIAATIGETQSPDRCIALVDMLLDGAGKRFDQVVAVVAAAMVSAGDLERILATDTASSRGGRAIPG